ncbi:hypothetical protein BDB01DRAFT_898284 [Pilobolus umbonatus]|nr:hypothetical protein BDB01DRAFT_898284 [Pilobolus umbonatus]
MTKNPSIFIFLVLPHSCIIAITEESLEPHLILKNPTVLYECICVIGIIYKGIINAFILIETQLQTITEESLEPHLILKNPTVLFECIRVIGIIYKGIINAFILIETQLQIFNLTMVDYVDNAQLFSSLSPKYRSHLVSSLVFLH